MLERLAHRAIHTLELTCTWLRMVLECVELANVIGPEEIIGDDLMPPVCPICKKYDWLSTPILIEGLRDKGFKPVVCENCGWSGEADDLDEVDAD
jgi:hypothetical protein